MPDQLSRNSSATVDASAVPSLIPQGSFLGKPEIALNRPVITVGSADSSRLHLVSSTVSHAHALIVRSDGQTYIADLASRSGVQVNGQTTAFAYLKSGDRVQIGRFVFRFRAPESSSPPMPPAKLPPASIDLSGELPIDLGDKPIFTIGRRETNDLPLTNDRHVSTVHAVIFPIDGQWYVRDLHSRKGTRLNGSGIHQHQLDFNDSIQIGSFTMRFQPASTESAASTSGLDFSVEPTPATIPAEPQEMDLSVDLPPPLEDESAPIPLEVDELKAQIPVESELPAAATEPLSLDDLEPISDLPMEPQEEPPAAVSPPPIPVELELPTGPEEPLSLDDLEPISDLPMEPQEEQPAATSAEEPIPAAFDTNAGAIGDPDEFDISALEPLEPEPIAKERLLIPPAIPEPVVEIPSVPESALEEPLADPFAAKTGAIGDPDEFDISALEPLEPEPVAKERPLIPPAIPEPVAEIPSVPEPALDEPLADPFAAIIDDAEPEELDLTMLESFEPIPAIESEPSVQAELNLEEFPVEPEAAVFDAVVPEISSPPQEVEQPALESPLTAADLHALPAAEPDDLELSLLESLEPISEIESEPSLQVELELEELPANPFTAAADEPAAAETVKPEPAITPAEIPAQPAIESDELDLSLLESLEPIPPIESEPSFHVPLELEDLDAAPPIAAANELVAEKLPAPSSEAPAEIPSEPEPVQEEIAAEPIPSTADELDLSLLEQLEPIPPIESEPSFQAAVNLEELPPELTKTFTAEIVPPVAAPSEAQPEVPPQPIEPVAEITPPAPAPNEIELASPYPADVADLIYPSEVPAEAAPTKPKRKRAPAKKKTTTKAKSKAKSGVEILDPTEPTLESALALGSAVESVPAAISPPEMLSDTTFGRAVEEFTGSSSGPIIDEPTTPPLSRESEGSAAESISNEQAQTDQTTFPPEIIQSGQVESAPMPLKDLSQIHDGEEFVAVPEPEPQSTSAEPAELQLESLTLSSTKNNEQNLTHPAAVESAPPIDEPPITDESITNASPVETSPIEISPGDTSPVETIPVETGLIEDSPPESTTAEQSPLVPESPVAEPPAIETAATVTDASTPSESAPPTTAAPSRPSIFGFQFEGGSFLGGMPLKLKPAPEAPKTQSPVFDEPALDRAPAEPTAFPLIPPPAKSPLTFTNYAPPAEPIVMPVKSPPAAEAPAAPAVPPPAPPSPAPRVAAPPPRAQPPAAPPGVRPTRIPPRPGLIPPRPKRLADAMAVPPLAKSVATTPPPRRNLSTAFDGLANAPTSLTGGMIGGPTATSPPASGFSTGSKRGAPRGTDVFSQVADPISVEVFGAVQGNADDFVIPEVRKPLMPSPPRPSRPPNASDNMPDDDGLPLTEEDLQDAGIPTEPMAEMLQPTVAEPVVTEPPIGLPVSAAAPPPARPSRRLRVPVLLVMMILLLAATWTGVYYFVPLTSRITGTLGFSNLAAQPMASQQIFQLQQLSRLHSEEVRSMARSMLVSTAQSPGFLDDAPQFERALSNAGKVEFTDNGEKLQVPTKVTDAALGKAQIDALLKSLKQKDADLLDNQARAKQAADDAQAALNQVNTHLEDLKAQRTAEQARGENRPDPAQIAALAAQSEKLNKAWNLAKLALSDAQTELADLKAADHPSTPDNDPKLNRLRKQSDDLDQQISPLQTIADLSHSTLDQDNQLQDLKNQFDDTAAQIKTRLAEIAIDRTLSPQQYESVRQKQIAAITAKLPALQDAAATDAVAVHATDDKLASLNNQLAQARDANTDDLIAQITAAQTDLKAKKDDAIDKNQKLAQCVSLAGDPQVSVQALPDQRPIFAGIASGLILVIFSFMIVSASRSSSVPISDRPAPHPQPHPAAPQDNADEPSPVSL